MAPNTNGTSLKWHFTIYIVVKSPGLALNKLGAHCNTENALPFNNGKKLVFQFKFGLEKCLEVFI